MKKTALNNMRSAISSILAFATFTITSLIFFSFSLIYGMEAANYDRETIGLSYAIILLYSPVIFFISFAYYMLLIKKVENVRQKAIRISLFIIALSAISYLFPDKLFNFIC